MGGGRAGEGRGKDEGGRDSKAKSAHKFVLLYETEVETNQISTLFTIPLFVFAVSTDVPFP